MNIIFNECHRPPFIQRFLFFFSCCSHLERCHQEASSSTVTKQKKLWYFATMIMNVNVVVIFIKPFGMVGCPSISHRRKAIWCGIWYALRVEGTRHTHPRRTKGDNSFSWRTLGPFCVCGIGGCRNRCQKYLPKQNLYKLVAVMRLKFWLFVCAT